VSVVTDSTTEAALSYCRHITRTRARNFYYGLKLLPEPKRSALYAIYAWMRRADDIADDASDVTLARARLEEFRAVSDAAIAGDPVDDGDPVLVSLQAVAREFTLDPEHFHAMLDGQADDLHARHYETFDDLREYCYRVASSVGLVCISIWGYGDERAPSLAIDLGVAFQLTNILRDLREDHEAGRVYLPAEDFRRHGLTIEELLRGEPSDACRAMLAEQLERADGHYRRAAPLESLITPSCRSTLWAMRTIYHRLLEKMMADPLAAVRPRRLRLSTVEKGTIAFRARLRGRGRDGAR
jgi:phytoene synthase